MAALRSRTSLLLHQRLQQARPRSLDAVAVVDDGLWLYPWQVIAGVQKEAPPSFYKALPLNVLLPAQNQQAAAAGDEEMHRRLMGMPEATRQELAKLAASGAVASARISAAAMPENGSEEGGDPRQHNAAEAVSAAQATAAWWGVDGLANEGEQGAGCGIVDENRLARDLALMMEAPIRCEWRLTLGRPWGGKGGGMTA